MIYQRQFWLSRAYDVILLAFVIASLKLTVLKSPADILVTGTIIFDIVLTLVAFLTVLFFNSSQAVACQDPDIQTAIALHEEYQDVVFLRSFIQTFIVFPIAAYLIGNYFLMTIEIGIGTLYWLLSLVLFGPRKRVMI